MTKFIKYFPLSMTVYVLFVIGISYKKHELPKLLNLNDLNKKLRVLQTTSRKSLIDNDLAEQLIDQKNYSSN